MARLTPTSSTIKRLFALSGNVCAFPGCTQSIFENENTVGQVCHIEAAEEKGQRYNPDQSDEERRNFENLIVLCPTHHAITNDVQKYTVPVLQKMKLEHESKFTSVPYNVPQYAIDDQHRRQLLLSGRAHSIARCIARWQAVGLPKAEAHDLAIDPSVGRPPPQFTTSINGSLAVLTAELGTGKSLLIERLYQEAVDNVLDNPSLPIPIFLNAASYRNDLVDRDLVDSIEHMSKDYGDIQVRGATVFVDGIDELGIYDADKFLMNARSAIHVWPRTTIIVTSRPNAVFRDIEEQVVVNALTEKDSQNLISRIARQDSIFLRGKPKSFQSAVRRPLFALLYGMYLRSHQRTQPLSIGELISFLVEESLGRIELRKSLSNQMLQKLALLSIEHSSPLIPLSELGTLTNVVPLLESRLIVEEGSSVRFALPILSEWFAAQSLADGNPLIEKIIVTEKYLEKWRYPLIVLIATVGFDSVSKIIAPICELFPCFAAEVLSDAISEWNMPNHDLVHSEIEYGQRLITSMQAWTQGVGKIAKLIAPINEYGELRPVQIACDQHRFAHAWYYGSNEQLPKISVFSEKIPAPREGWPSVCSTKIGRQPAWMWKYTQDLLAEQLSYILNNRLLPNTSEELLNEKIWNDAIIVMKYGSLWPHPIDLNKLDSKLQKLSKMGTLYARGYRTLSPKNIRILTLKVNQLRDDKKLSLDPPWPTGDVEQMQGGWLWDMYSDDQLQKRVIAIYQQSLTSYTHLVNSWFSKFATKSNMSGLLPVRFVGELQPSSGGMMGPRLAWYLEPIEIGGDSLVDIRLVDETTIFAQENLHGDLQNLLRRLRPDSSAWSNTTLHQQHISTLLQSHPVTTTVYKWLWDDLTDVSWTRGLFE